MSIIIGLFYLKTKLGKNINVTKKKKKKRENLKSCLKFYNFYLVKLAFSNKP